MKVSGKHYTEEQAAEIKRRVEDGQSYTQVAEELQLATRSQVAGLVHRLRRGMKISPRPRQYRPDVALSNRRRRRPGRKPEYSPPGQWASLPAYYTPPERLTDAIIEAPRMKCVPVEELEEDSCRWPMWPHTRQPWDLESLVYCGAVAEPDKPYCACHCEIAYVPAGRVNTWLIPKETAA